MLPFQLGNKTEFSLEKHSAGSSVLNTPATQTGIQHYNLPKCQCGHITTQGFVFVSGLILTGRRLVISGNNWFRSLPKSVLLGKD